MAGQKITKRVVDAAEPRDSRYIVFDSLITGFGLRVMPTGAKSFIYEYRPGEGGRALAKRRYTIGKATDLTADQARKEAERLRALVATGGDPMESKSDARKAATVEEVASLWLSSHVKAKRSDGTHEHYRDLLDRIIIPALGNLKAKTLPHSKVARLHDDWSHTPFQANRILSCISAFYNWAGSASVGLVPKGHNPADDIEKFEEQGRERPLEPDELLRLADALRLAETTGIPWDVEKPTSKHLAKADKRVTVFSPHVVGALRLLMFTGARLREILNLEWKQVDLARGVLLLPKHKTRRLTGVKVIVLNAPALEVLTGLERIGKYVIASDSAGTPEEKPRPDIKKPWASIKRHAQLEDLRINDLRHNFATFGVGGGMGLPIVGKLLGHTKASTTERYAHLQVDPLRRATETIGADLLRALGHSERQPNNVVPLKDARKG
ncbi:tyrosine-type recombinase/integrase [Devosia naphthalenivorans]|uniref:tyrosine-type recombinase/integrase n=1 Tax=Devosia naphthalenivorans TaxID=2082392 RepID=UPI000D3498D8|nr:tyrosine-type recombinase/integrase [Devosia naphthalenivorans]